MVRIVAVCIAAVALSACTFPVTKMEPVSPTPEATQAAPPKGSPSPARVAR